MSINANAATLCVERSAPGAERPLPQPMQRPFDAHAMRISPAALATVLAAHAAAWLGLSGYAAETQPPIERPILISLITPAAEPPKTAPPLAPPKISKPVSRPVEKTVARMPVETARPLPEPLLAVPAATPQEALPPAAEAVPQDAPAQAEDAPPTQDLPQAVAVAPQPAPIALPRFNADYLDNPAPAYPSLSRRLGEEGRVLLRVQVNADGTPTQVLLQQSSGHARLDEVASATVRRWQFVPARQGGRPVEAWVTVPIKFSLKG